MAALREVKKEIGNDFTAAQFLTEGTLQQMLTELTKAGGCSYPTITPEMISAAVTQSAAGMDGNAQKEALDKFGQALAGFLNPPWAAGDENALTCRAAVQTGKQGIGCP